MKFFIYTLSLSLSLFCTQSGAQSIVYVNQNATGTNTGTSWANAFTNLHSALNSTGQDDEIWVAEGIYTPNTPNFVDRDRYFNLSSGVKLYGGFGGNEQSLAERNIAAHATILSGDIGVLGDSTDNSYNILVMITPNTSTVFDGFVVEKGTANSNSTTSIGNIGAGLFINGGTTYAYPVINNIIFRNNAAYIGGAVAMITDFNSSGKIIPNFQNCIFESNTSIANNLGTKGGGAVYLFGSKPNGIVERKEFYRCIFRNNRSLDTGGAVSIECQDFEKFEFIECEFTNNISKRIGGGVMVIQGSSNLLFKNCMFKENTAMIGSGFYYSDINSEINSIEVDSCIFDRNKSIGLLPSSSLLGSAFNIEAFNFGAEIKITHSQFLNNGGFFAAGVYTAYDNKIIFSDNILEGDLYGSEISGDDSIVISRNIIRNCGKLITIGTNKNSKKYYFSENIVANSYIEANKSMKNGFINGNIFVNNVFPGDEKPWNSATNVDTPIVFSNNIFWNNKNLFPSTGRKWTLPLVNSPSKFYNNIVDFEPTDSIPEFWDMVSGNKYNQNPLFLDTLSGNYRLSACSPARDAGAFSWLNGGISYKDIAGNPRVTGSSLDIGPYEFQGLGLLNPPQIVAACPSTSNGAVIFNLKDGCDPYLINWKSGNASGSGTTNLSAGLYSFTITDQLGQTITVPDIAIAEGSTPIIGAQIAPTPCNTCNDGSITMQISGGALPFAYQWSTGESTQNISNLLPGFYTVTITDQAGCTFTNIYEVKVSVGTTELSKHTITIAPNPATDYLIWTSTGTGDVLKLYDWNGRLLLISDKTGTLSLSGLPSGSYTSVVYNSSNLVIFTKQIAVIR
jgi:hypothetical protein